MNRSIVLVVLPEYLDLSDTRSILNYINNSLDRYRDKMWYILQYDNHDYLENKEFYYPKVYTEWHPNRDLLIYPINKMYKEGCCNGIVGLELEWIDFDHYKKENGLSWKERDSAWEAWSTYFLEYLQKYENYYGVYIKCCI
ncbi:hypothetical protein [Teredinibacter turnerae]|uniref:hypothetical protein n=1 Tax=Teredinibacter turnerae TaxID=2426 RepID=UPI001E407760|nr:hypothetical protein [Teredinibacter turnerae]